MVRSFVLPFLAVASFAAFARADEKYSSTTGKYTATFPSAPKETSTPDADVNPAMGKYKYFFARVEINKDQACMTMYHDYPQGVIKDEPQVVLEKVRDGWKMLGRLVEDREIALGTDKVPGRAFIISQGTAFYRVRAFLKDARLYQVVFEGKSKDEVTAAAADKFLDSFAIAK